MFRTKKYVFGDKVNSSKLGMQSTDCCEAKTALNKKVLIFFFFKVLTTSTESTGNWPRHLADTLCNSWYQ